MRPRAALHQPGVPRLLQRHVRRRGDYATHASAVGKVTTASG
jgi:hypothetical protein